MSKHKEICLFWCSGVQQYPITMSGIQFDLKSFRCKVSDLMLPSDQWRPKGMTWRDHVATFSHRHQAWCEMPGWNPIQSPPSALPPARNPPLGWKKVYIYYNGKTQCLRMAAMPICKQCLPAPAKNIKWKKLIELLGQSSMKMDEGRCRGFAMQIPACNIM